MFHTRYTILWTSFHLYTLRSLNLRNIVEKMQQHIRSSDISIVQNSHGICRSYRKRSAYPSAMNKLLQTRNRYPNGILNSFVTALQNRNLHRMNHIDERSSDVERIILMSSMIDFIYVTTAS